MNAHTDRFAAYDDALLEAMAKEAGKFERTQNAVRDRTRATCLTELEKGSRFTSDIIDHDGLASVAAIATCLRKMAAMSVPLVDRELCPKDGSNREFWLYSINKAGRIALLKWRASQ